MIDLEGRGVLSTETDLHLLWITVGETDLRLQMTHLKSISVQFSSLSNKLVLLHMMIILVQKGAYF